MANLGQKPWDRRQAQGAGAKPKRQLRRILILSEDSKSSILYFKKFKVKPSEIEIDCVGTGKNTDSLMDEAIRRKQSAVRAGSPYNQIWVVFDRDSFPKDNFQRTFELGHGHNDIQLCWSNECFELWYLLHFDFFDTPVDRHDLPAKISKKIGIRYDKADDKIHEHLKDHLPRALQNAKRLEIKNGKAHRYGNPSTRVHHLIELLLKFAEDSDTVI